MANGIVSVRVTEYTWVEYHTPRWGELVEQGWVTMYTEAGPEGSTMARMIWQS